MGLRLDPTNQNVTDFDKLEQNSVCCKGCDKYPLKGIRFRCKVCDNYDLCKKCFERRTEVHNAHDEFLQIPDESTYLLGSDDSGASE